MTHIHDMLASVQRTGALGFDETSLARDHGPVARRVGRARAARTAAISVVGVGAAGAIAFAAQGLVRGNELGPIATPTPSVSESLPSPTATAIPDATISVNVSPGPRIDRVAEALAEEFDVTPDQALAARTNALPPEANGNAEGWVGAGTYTLGENDTLDQAAAALVQLQVGALTSAGVPRSDWERTVIIASIIEQETPNPSQMSMVARVIENRLAAQQPLEVQSPLAYDLRADEQPVGDDGWAVDTPYNLYLHEGLPPTAVGAPAREALMAAIEPASGDWLYFLIHPDTGAASFFLTFEEYAAAVDEVFPGTGASE
jgi:cell division protein YceG involved in septum cleavage